MNELFQQKRFRKFPVRLEKIGASNSRLIVPVTQITSEIHSESALENLKTVGDRVLPGRIGPATRKNLDGKIIVHKNQPKEPYSWETLWGRWQWRGGGESEWVEDYVTHSRMRYPRTHIPAENIEVLLIENSKGEQFFASEVISHKAPEKWLMAANVMLEIFGFFWAINPEDLDTPLVITRRVNWRLLPKGRKPWNEIKPDLKNVIGNLKSKTQQRAANRQLELINQFGPEQVVIGQGGFSHYVAFCFESRGFTILESVEPNNATYILGENWETLSKLSKAEILSQGLELERVIHGSRWEFYLHRWFPKSAA